MVKLEAGAVKRMSEESRPEAVSKLVADIESVVAEAAKSGLKSVRVFAPFDLVDDVAESFRAAGFQTKTVSCGDTNLQIVWE